jgi:hypothetical protein
MLLSEISNFGNKYFFFFFYLFTIYKNLFSIFLGISKYGILFLKYETHFYYPLAIKH